MHSSQTAYGRLSGINRARSQSHPFVFASSERGIHQVGNFILVPFCDFQLVGKRYVHGVALASSLDADGLHEILKPFAWINVCRNFLPNLLSFPR
jgi:hypothetical protein